MLGFLINGEYLDLFPDTVLELESNNTFLNFEDTIAGSYSLPFDLPVTERNMRLLSYPAYFQTRISNTVNCICIRNGIQHSTGKLRMEQIQHHLNDYRKGKLSVYYLFGSSDFYQEIKDKKLNQIEWGGNRMFSWDGGIETYNETGSGFWAHIHTVLRAAPGSYDYAFYPVINNEFMSEQDHPMLHNAVKYAASNVSFYKSTLNDDPQNAFKFAIPNLITPYPYLSKLLIAIGSNIGWTIKGDVFTDTDFNKITLLGCRAINWAKMYNWLNVAYAVVPHSSISFNLKDHLPDVTISEFLIGLKNRLGLWYDFDYRTKTLSISWLKNVILNTSKDHTFSAVPAITKKILNDAKNYALRTQFTGSLGEGKPDFTKMIKQPAVNTKSALPTPTDAQYLHARLVLNENNWYVCGLKDDTTATTEDLEWKFLAHNIYDYEPTSSDTEDINTTVGTVGSEKNDYINTTYANYMELLPRFDNPGIFPGFTEDEAAWGVYLLFSHGMKNNSAATPYPFASNGIYDISLNEIGNWGLTYECFKSDGTDVGLYTTFWKEILSILNSTEQCELTLTLPFSEYLKLKLSDRIVISGVRIFISQLKEQIPYTGQINLTTLRTG